MIVEAINDRYLRHLWPFSPAEAYGPKKALYPNAISRTCKPVIAGRGYIEPQLWHAIVEVEVFAGRDWIEVVSTDNVTCLVAVLRPRALREVRP